MIFELSTFLSLSVLKICLEKFQSYIIEKSRVVKFLEQKIFTLKLSSVLVCLPFPFIFLFAETLGFDSTCCLTIVNLQKLLVEYSRAAHILALDQLMLRINKYIFQFENTIFFVNCHQTWKL